MMDFEPAAHPHCTATGGRRPAWVGGVCRRLIEPSLDGPGTDRVASPMHGFEPSID